MPPSLYKKKTKLLLLVRGGQANFLKFRNRKSVNSWAYSAITNPQISYVCQSTNGKSANFYYNLQIANPQVSTKYCTTLSQKSPKSRLFSWFLLCTNFKSIMQYLYGEKVCICGRFKSANHKKRVRKSQITTGRN
jgi:hypothetical protein